jgi:hypothetical protein
METIARRGSRISLISISARSRRIISPTRACRKVAILEVDGKFDNLEEMIYVESHLSKTGTKYYGEMTHFLLKHKEYPGSDNGTGLFQVLVGLKMREVY